MFHTFEKKEVHGSKQQVWNALASSAVTGQSEKFRVFGDSQRKSFVKRRRVAKLFFGRSLENLWKVFLHGLTANFAGSSRFCSLINQPFRCGDNTLQRRQERSFIPKRQILVRTGENT